VTLEEETSDQALINQILIQDLEERFEEEKKSTREVNVMQDFGSFEATEKSPNKNQKMRKFSDKSEKAEEKHVKRQHLAREIKDMKKLKTSSYGFADFSKKDHKNSSSDANM